jgi:spore germination protein KA
MGLFGIQFGFLLLLIHLCSLRSFGQPYFQPFGPLILQDIKDSIIRFPLWLNIIRLKLFGGRNPKRQTKKQKPQNPEEKRK